MQIDVNKAIPDMRGKKFKKPDANGKPTTEDVLLKDIILEAIFMRKMLPAGNGQVMLEPVDEVRLLKDRKMADKIFSAKTKLELTPAEVTDIMQKIPLLERNGWSPILLSSALLMLEGNSK